MKAGQVVGVLAIPGRTVEILPKIEGENGAGRLILLYPWTRGLPPGERAREWTVGGTGIPLEVATIDVGCPDTAADALRRLIGPARNTAPRPTGPPPDSAPGVRVSRASCRL